MRDIAIVVPCYNEAERLELQRFSAFAERWPGTRFFFVNDGSTDATGAILSRFCRSCPDLFRALHLSVNQGKAEAVRQGVLVAFASRPRYVGFWDADLATPLEVVQHFATILDENPAIELVMGARVQLLGRRIERRPLRHYLGRIFATAASLMLALRVYDTQCGAKLFRASSEVNALFATPFRARWLFDVELMARLLAGRRGTDLPAVDEIVYEFPLLEWRDVSGSKLSTRDFLLAPQELGKIYWTYNRTVRGRSTQRHEQ